MENQKTVNLSNSSENEFSKFATKKWFVNDSETKGEYPHHDPIKFLTKSIVILMNIFYLQEILLLQELLLLQAIILFKQLHK